MTLKNSFKNIVLFIFLLSLVTSLNAAKKRGEYATQNLVGQDYYLIACSSCHGEGSMGGNMASIREWSEIFSNKASLLISFHSEDDENIEVMKYLKSKKFINKDKKEILSFLQEFAYDSENIPTCN